MIIKSSSINIKSIIKKVESKKKVICCPGGDISTGILQFITTLVIKD